MMIINKIKKKGVLNTIIYIIGTPVYNVILLFYKILIKKIKVNQKYILFYSIPDFSDNAKILYEYYRNSQKYSNYTFIWLLGKKENIQKYKNMYKNTIFVKCESKLHHGQTFKSLYYIAKSKLIFYTHISPINNNADLKKKNQIVINLWHGCGYKNIENRSKKDYEKTVFDYALVPGSIFIETKSKFWNCPRENVIAIGYPRYDLMFKENEKTKAFVKNIVGNNKKIIMWMPTFRKTIIGEFPEEKIKTKFDLPIIESIKNLYELNELCKKNDVIICVKRHPFQIRYECEDEELSNICFISNKTLENEGVELYSLLRYTDGLITDYSSVAIDYLLLDKPIAFTLE